MQVGNKIFELRKSKNMSQEELAAKLKVSRQTISKWELGETSPALTEARELSKIFGVSLDDLTNNNIKNVIEKNSNKKEITKIIINILKIILLFIIIIVIVLLVTIFFNEYFSVSPNSEGYAIECEIEDEKYTYEVWTKSEEPKYIITFKTSDKNLGINYQDYAKKEWLLEAIKEDVIARGGTCNN